MFVTSFIDKICVFETFKMSGQSLMYIKFTNSFQLSSDGLSTLKFDNFNDNELLKTMP